MKSSEITRGKRNDWNLGHVTLLRKSKLKLKFHLERHTIMHDTLVLFLLTEMK